MRMAKTLNVKTLVAFEIFNKAEVSPVRAAHIVDESLQASLTITLVIYIYNA